MSSSKPEPYDLIVIGGGINGAAIARDAALRGLHTVLLEKDDFGSGASTKTSKLAHGGIRYLQQFQFGLVKESLRERALLLKNAPHLVKPLLFLLPVYGTDPHSLWQINLGLFLYDFLAGSHLPKHCKLNTEKLLTEVPGLKEQDLKGGCSYYDGQMLDNRIVIENLISAERAGAKVYNYAKVTSLILDKHVVKGINFYNSLTDKEGIIYGKTIVNATGAWSEQIGEMEPNASHCSPAPTKGVHLIVPQVLSNKALLLRAPQDGRVFFILPWEQFSLIGTTDTFFNGNPDKLVVDEDDRGYLLKAYNAYFPSKQLKESSIIASFVGLRPLVSPNKENSPSDIIREHAIQVSKGGLITILGGKYTTHRQIAEEVVDTVVIQLKSRKGYLPCSTAKIPLPGASGPDSMVEIKKKFEDLGCSQRLISHLLNTYGTLSLKILEIIVKDPSEAEAICDFYPHVLAELTYGVKVEHVKKLTDWFSRRTTLVYNPSQLNQCVDPVAQKLASLLGWTKEQMVREIAAFHES